MKGTSPLVRISVRNGIIGGLLGSIMVGILFYLNPVHPLLISPFMDLRVFLFPIFIFFTLKEYKARFSNGILYFWQGMIASYIFLISFGVICFLFILIFATVVPEFGAEYSKQSLVLLKNNPDFINMVGEEEFKRNFSEAQPTNGLRLGLVYFMWTLVIGFFMSIVLTVILRKAE
jgi:hypothetical protein